MTDSTTPSLAEQLATKDRAIAILQRQLMDAEVYAARYRVLRDELHVLDSPPILVISGACRQGHAMEHLSEDELDTAVDKLRSVVDARDNAIEMEIVRGSNRRSKRESIADLAYMNYDFGDDEVMEDEGWEHVEPGNEWTRKLYMQPEEGDDEMGSSTRLTFTVLFNDDDTLAEVYAISASGNIWGKPDRTGPHWGQ